ncbi:MAG: hypothetical protein WC683_03620 [bacterium]
MAGDSVKCVPTKTKSCSANDIPLCTDVLKEELGYFEGKFFGMQELAVVKDEKGKEEFTTFLPASSYAEAGMPDPRGEPGVRTLKDRDNPKTPANENELDEVVYSGYLDLNKLDGICRLSQKTDAGKEWNKYYAYTGRLGHMLFSNEDASNDIDDSDIDLPVGEMKVIIPALGLGPTDFAVKAGSKPYAKEEGGPVMNTFHFSGQYNRLEQIIDRLNKVKGVLTAQGSGVSAATVDSLSAHLEKIYAMYKMQIDSTEEQLELSRKSMDSIPMQKWLTIAGIFSGLVGTAAFVWFMHRANKKGREDSWKMHKESMDEMKASRGENASVAGDNIKFEDMVEDSIGKARGELKSLGTFEMPYIDTDRKVSRMIDVSLRPQADQNNWLSAGQSRTGKTASLRGYAQMLALSELTENEREVFYKKTTERMSPKDARAYREGVEANIASIKTELEKGGHKGILIYEADINNLKAKGAVWADKDVKILEEKLIDPVLAKAREGYKVILFIDEIQQAEDGSRDGRIALRDRIKKVAEKHPNITLAIATTIQELSDTIARDPASLNRYVTIFHEAASPKKVANILELKPYVNTRYGVLSIEPDALRATYILGLKAHAKPSALTAVETFFNDVLQQAQKDGVTAITTDYVLEYFEKHHGENPAALGLSKDKIRSIFNYEIKEIEVQNERDKARLRVIEESAGEASRVTAPWWEASSDSFLNVDPEPECRQEPKPAPAASEPKPAAPAPAAVAAAPAPAPAAPVPLEADMNDPRAREVEIMRKTLLREAREWPKDGSVIPFNIETYTETDQRNFATMAYTEFEGMKKDESKWSKYLEIKDNAGVFKPGAAHKLLAQGMKRASHPSRGLVNGLCKGLDKMRDERAKAEKKVARDAAKEAARRGK